MLGHSFGAPLAVAWAAERPVAGVVACSPVGVVPLELRRARLVLPFHRALAAHRAGLGRRRRVVGAVAAGRVRLVRRHGRAGWARPGARPPDAPRRGPGRTGRAAGAPGARGTRPRGLSPEPSPPRRSCSGAISTRAGGRAGRRWSRRCGGVRRCYPAWGTCRCSRRRTPSRWPSAGSCRSSRVPGSIPAARSDPWRCRACGTVARACDSLARGWARAARRRRRGRLPAGQRRHRISHRAPACPLRVRRPAWT